MYSNYWAEDLIEGVEAQIKYGLIKFPSMEQNNKVVIILSGMPCSGKSTWVVENIDKIMSKYKAPVVVISRDVIRLQLFGGKYKQNNNDEKEVTLRFYATLAQASALDNVVIILDNTHLKLSEISNYLYIFKTPIEAGKLKVYVKFFDIPYWKAFVRNIVRYWHTDKWIPINVLRNFSKRSKDIRTYNFKKELLYE